MTAAAGVGTAFEALDLDRDQVRNVVQRQLAGRADEPGVVEGEFGRAKSDHRKVYGVEHVLAADEIVAGRPAGIDG